MGSAQSYISSEAALTTLVVAGAIGLGYSQISHRLAFTGAITDDTKATPQTDKSEQTTRKGNKKKQPKSSVVLSSDTSDKGTDNQQPLNASSVTHSAAPRRVVDAPGSFPGQFEPGASPNHQLSNVAPAVPLSSSSKSKKPKKKKAKTAVTTDPVVQEAAATSSSADHSTEILVKSKTKNAKRQQQPQPSSSASITRPLQQSTTSIDTDESWTRVGSVRRDMASSFDAPTTSDPDTGLTPQTGNSSPVAERGTESEGPSSFLLDISSRDSGDSRRKTLAEKLLPKPRKTGVDDMLETPDYPTLARVIRVQPLPDEKPVSGFSWGDYEDVRVTTNGAESDADGEDDGWGVVKSKRQRVPRTASSLTSSSQAHRASETITKRQRQNGQRRVREKAEKAAAEEQRQAALAKHKRELDTARILEQYSGKSGGKSFSGGMKASVDERGKLVWE